MKRQNDTRKRNIEKGGGEIENDFLYETGDRRVGAMQSLHIYNVLT